MANKKINGLITDYLTYRVKHKVVRGDNPDHYLGLDPDDALFISYQGKGFSLVRKDDNYTCDALNRHIKGLLRQSGIEQPSVLSGKRTFAVNLYQQGCDIVHLMHMFGDRSIETTKRLVETNPVSMASISANAF